LKVRERVKLGGRHLLVARDGHLEYILVSGGLVRVVLELLEALVERAWPGRG